MIDIESSVYTKVRQALKAYNSDIDVSGEFVNEPSKFPCVYIEEIDNYAIDLDSGDAEKRAYVTYEVNIYTNNSGKKKSTAKAILDVVDKVLYTYNFTRMAATPVPNRENTTIYRIVARYRAKTDGNTIYRG